MTTELSRIKETLAYGGIRLFIYRAFIWLRMVFKLVLLGRGSSMMWPEEREYLATLVQRTEPKVIVEIGTAWGGSLQVWCNASDGGTEIITIDLPGGKLFGGGFPGCAKWAQRFYRGFARGNQQIHFVTGDSACEQTVSEVNRILDGRKIDLLFIDGNHSYEGVRRDFLAYMPLTSGTIILHDINPFMIGKDEGVPKLWNELERDYAETASFISRPRKPGFGFGVIGDHTLPLQRTARENFLGWNGLKSKP